MEEVTALVAVGSRPELLGIHSKMLGSSGMRDFVGTFFKQGAMVVEAVPRLIHILNSVFEEHLAEHKPLVYSTRLSSKF